VKVELDTDAELTIDCAPLEPWPDDARAWLEAALRQGGAAVRLLAVEPATTATGWPVELVDAMLEPGGPVLAAIFHFGAYAGLAVVRGPRARAATVLKTGRPVWQGRYGLTTIAELWK
jgi:hypothetical protein